ncbi:MAG TPA: hypothetical protein VK390_13970 [Propionibacteriaceae bacterium]|nr:hypothetical protein [Propionibacteriaceae bacterium]
MLDIVKSADVFSTSSIRRILIAVVLRRRANLSWYSGGGRFHIVATPEVAVASRSHSCLTGCYGASGMS